MGVLVPLKPACAPMLLTSGLEWFYTEAHCEQKRKGAEGEEKEGGRIASSGPGTVAQTSI